MWAHDVDGPDYADRLDAIEAACPHPPSSRGGVLSDPITVEEAG